MKLFSAFVFGLLVTTSSPRADDEPRPAVAAMLPELYLSSPPWNGGPIHRESVLFVQEPGAKPAAKLLFDARSIVSVERADRTQKYELERDFTLSSDGSTLSLTPNSRIFFQKQSEFRRPKGSPNSIAQLRDHPETHLLFAQGHVWHDWQVEVTYDPKNGNWAGYKLTFAGEKLPKTIARLKNKQPITLSVSGDSISEGYNASGFTGGKPFTPAYPGLVAAQLEAATGAKISLKNRSIAGWTTLQGVKDLPKLLADKPDLVIIAYGMNDIGYRSPEAFKSRVSELITGIKSANPDSEIILVSPMLANPEWQHTPPEFFPQYRDALSSLQTNGVALADMTAIWENLFSRKKSADTTGNGVNHPNDYGHRLYASAILSLLLEVKP